MRYKVGMYGGSFDPLHLGHISDIIKAAAVCEELYVMISWCEGRESTSKELRYRWILNCPKHLPNVRIILVEDQAVSKEVYNTDYYWEKGARDIKNTIGKPIDAVFCGSDYLGTNRFESLYCPESAVIYFDREEVPISSTEIREWASAHWDYLPEVCKDYYARKVLVVGGESTGKSTLVQNLALAYNTNYVAEYGRVTADYAGGEDFMLADDLHENLLRQRINIIDAAKKSNRILFVDTDAITTLFYSRFLLQNQKQIEVCEKLATAINEMTQWDLVLFLEPDVEFIQDGTRNEKIRANREKYSQQIKQALTENNVAYHCLTGDYLERFETAKQLIAGMGITTRF
ncbi:MAG: AAA family ATPase [Bacteroidaceae bacterium]|nr:AAA family ATPase [Bacteroidaceae bacterium]